MWLTTITYGERSKVNELPAGGKEVTLGSHDHIVALIEAWDPEGSAAAQGLHLDRADALYADRKHGSRKRAQDCIDTERRLMGGRREKV